MKSFDISTQRSKTLDPYVDQRFDYVITVCDRARQSCPVFPGADQSLHWDIADPAEVEGSDDDKAAAFRTAYADLRGRIEGFVRTAGAQCVAP